MDKENLTLLLGVFGALAWLAPYVYDLWRKPHIEGKLVSLSFSPSMDYSNPGIGSLHGCGDIMKFVLTALNKNFNVKAVSIRFRLEAGAWRSGQIFWTKTIRLDHPSPKGPQPALFLVPQDKHVSVLTIVECDHIQEVYIPFIIDYSGDPTLDEIELRLTDYAENDQIVRIFLKDVDMKNLIYEEDLWRVLTM